LNLKKKGGKEGGKRANIEMLQKGKIYSAYYYNKVGEETGGQRVKKESILRVNLAMMLSLPEGR